MAGWCTVIVTGNAQRLGDTLRYLYYRKRLKNWLSIRIRTAQMLKVDSVQCSSGSDSAVSDDVKEQRQLFAQQFVRRIGFPMSCRRWRDFGMNRHRQHTRADVTASVAVPMKEQIRSHE